MPDQSHPVRTTYSLRTNLVLLLTVCICPGLILSLVLAYTNYNLHRQQVYAETQLLAQHLIDRVDREFAAIESGLKVLATSETLRDGNFAEFQKIASGAVKSQIVYNYILTDKLGHQLVNTLRPFGSPLPTTGTPPQLGEVFTRGHTVLTDFFIGPVTKKPAIAMGVPVELKDGEVGYSLNIGLAPDKLNEILRATLVTEGWLAALIDSSGTIVARTRDEVRFVGQKAVPQLWEQISMQKAGVMETTTKEDTPVFTAFATSERWNWSIAVGAPKSIIQERLNATLFFIGLITTAVVGIAMWIALRIVWRLADTVEALNKAALDINNGRPISLATMPIAETNEIARALVRASELSTEIHHKAYHDALTGLANRFLFFEFLENCFARGRRDGEIFSLLMIDLDFFKEVNDHDGHAVGDSVLREAASRLRAEIREGDLAARLGGDEFAILLIGADRAIAFDVADRLHSHLSAPYSDSSVAITASIGAAIWNNSILDGNVLLEMADGALYQVKSKGRNGIQIAE